MKIEKFKIIQFVRELILMIDKDMDNFPKKDIEIKNRIRKNSYDILELVYEANTAIEIEYKKIVTKNACENKGCRFSFEFII